MNPATGETIDLTALEEDLANNNEPNNNDSQSAGTETVFKLNKGNLDNEKIYSGIRTLDQA